MKRTLRLNLLLGLLLSVPLAGPGEASGREPLKVLVITGGHGFDKKAFPKLFEGQEGMDVTIRECKGSPVVFDDISGWDYDVLVQYNFNQKITPQQQGNFLKLLNDGLGLVVMHHAIAAYPGWQEFEKIIGATYVLKATVRDGRKYVRPVWKHDVDFRLHVEDPSHPIMAGVKDFDVHDESYKHWVYHEGNHLLLSTENKLNNRQIAWTRKYGKARVVFMQLGHGPGIFTHADYKGIIGRAIHWTSAERE